MSPRSCRILIADDHAVVRRGLRTLIEAQPGWEACGEASNGQEAVEKAIRLRPDLIIIDVSMPDLNGFEATRQILTAAPQSQVLVLTMHDAPEIIERMVASGARGYVLKSDAERDLTTAVQAICHGRPFFTPAASEVMLEMSRERVGTRRGRSRALPKLTARERQVVRLLAQGKSNKQVAASLNISVRTVESHRSKVMRKLALKSFSDLVRYAVRNKIVLP